MRISPFSLIEKISSFRNMAKIRMDLLLPFIILSRSAARLRKDWENFSRKELKSGRLTKKESMIPRAGISMRVDVSHTRVSLGWSSSCLVGSHQCCSAMWSTAILYAPQLNTNATSTSAVFST